MSEEWKKEFFEWKDEIEGKFNNLSQKHSELKELLEANAELAEGNNTAIHNLVDGYIMFKDVLQDMLENKKQNTEKHLAELVDDPQIDVEFIKACEKQIEDAKRQLGKLETPKQTEKKEAEKRFLDLGIVSSENGELLDYTPSQFIKDYAKEHSLFSLIGLLFPLEDSGGSKSVPKSEEAIYKTDKELMEDNPSTEKHPEPCNRCDHLIENINKYGDFYCRELDMKMDELVKKCAHFTPKKREAGPEKDRKYPKVVYQLGSDSSEYIELKKKFDKLTEVFLKDWYELDNELTLEGKIRVQREKIKKWQGKQK